MSPLEMSPLAFAVAIGATLLFGALAYSVLRSPPRPRPPEHPPDQDLEDHERTRDEARRLHSASTRLRRSLAFDRERDERILGQLSDELHLRGEHRDDDDREGESWR